MKPYRLLHLVQHVSEKSVCPNCSASWCVENISINFSTDTMAFLSIYCAQCKKEMQANVFFNGVAELGPQAEITLSEVDAVHDFLSIFEGRPSDIFPDTP